LSRLLPSHQQALALHWSGALTGDAIGAALGLPPGPQRARNAGERYRCALLALRRLQPASDVSTPLNSGASNGAVEGPQPTSTNEDVNQVIVELQRAHPAWTWYQIAYAAGFTGPEGAQMARAL
jgi:hypothetical protein